MKRGKKIAAVCMLVVLTLFALTIAVYRNASYMVFENLTATKLKIEEISWSGGESYEKIPYASDSESQYLDLYVPYTSDDELPKLFVLVHGGGFITNDSQSKQAQLMYRYFRDNGFACATVNYRLAQEEAFPGALSDVKAAVRFLKAHAKEYGYDAGKVAIWGESAGGYLAVAASVTSDDEFMDVEYIGQKEYEAQNGFVSATVDACVDYYGAVELGKKDDDWKQLGIPLFIIDIANSWLHTDVLEGYSDVESFWLRKETGEMTNDELEASNLYYYVEKNLDDKSSIKFWIAHGDCDLTVPIMQSERFYSALCDAIGEDNVTFKVVHTAGHAGDIMYSEKELSQIKEYLNSIL